MARMYRVQVRVEKKVREQIERLAKKEGVPTAEFCRRLFEWSFDQYSRVGELAALRRMAVSSEKQKSARKVKEST
jgi:hypothetical protein